MDLKEVKKSKIKRFVGDVMGN